MTSLVGLNAYPKTKAKKITGKRISLVLTKFVKELKERGFARESLLDVNSAKALYNVESFTAVTEVFPITGKETGSSLKIKAATIDKTRDVSRLQKKVESQTKLLEPFFFPRDAVPAVIEKKTNGKTIKTPRRKVNVAMKFIAE